MSSEYDDSYWLRPPPSDIAQPFGGGQCSVYKREETHDSKGRPIVRVTVRLNNIREVVTDVSFYTWPEDMHEKDRHIGIRMSGEDGGVLVDERCSFPVAALKAALEQIEALE